MFIADHLRFISTVCEILFKKSLRTVIQKAVPFDLAISNLIVIAIIRAGATSRRVTHFPQPLFLESPRRSSRKDTGVEEKKKHRLSLGGAPLSTEFIQ